MFIYKNNDDRLNLCRSRRSAGSGAARWCLRAICVPRAPGCLTRAASLGLSIPRRRGGLAPCARGSRGAAPAGLLPNWPSPPSALPGGIGKCHGTRQAPLGARYGVSTAKCHCVAGGYLPGHSWNRNKEEALSCESCVPLWRPRLRFAGPWWSAQPSREGWSQACTVIWGVLGGLKC